MTTKTTNASGRFRALAGLPAKLALLLLGLAAVALAGCGGSSSDSASTGDVSISLTDSPGDFVAYTVDLVSLRLVKQNGAQVTVLPATTRVDFAQYTDLSEFFTVATVPSGTYTQVALVLNYSNADVEVQDDQGVVRQATLLDSNGSPLASSLSVTLDLPTANPLVIAPGVPAALALDFDLSASNQVLTTNPAVVQVEPFLLADVALDTTREHRARGLLKDVDGTAQTFSMQLRPFAVRERSWGLISVAGSSSTHYEIDGVSYDGQSGIDRLAAMPVDTPLIVTGTIGGRKLLNATEVLAGSSVPWSDKDAVQGTVIKRVGDLLTVRGHYIDRTDGVAVFNSDIEVLMDASTLISAPLSGQTVDKDSVSVGQAVTALGDLSSSGGQYQLDATGADNLVRMNVTQLKGTVQTQSGSLLNTDLAFIDGRRVGIFDFTGTGVSSADDSDPTSYDVETGQLLTGNPVANGDIVKLRGFVVPFGQASSAGDFSAISVIDLNQDALAANLALRWVGGTSSAFSSIADDAIVIDLSGIDIDNKNLWLAGVGVDLSATGTITLTPDDPTRGRYAIKRRGQVGVTLYREFADFSAALSSALSGGARVIVVTAHGNYAAADETLSTSAALVLLSR